MTETSRSEPAWPEADLAQGSAATRAPAGAGNGDAPVGGSFGELTRRMREEITAIDQELGEVALLAQQAASEAERHGARSSQTEERVIAARKGKTDPAEIADLDAQLVSLVKRGAMMESQAEVLQAKRKALARHRDSLAAYLGTVASLEALVLAGGTVVGDAPVRTAVPLSDEQVRAATAATDAGPGATRLVLGAQEDLRREIARAMHDGPAQSLTNIVLEAQIVERLLSRDPAAAKAEMHRLAAMVQATLDATKTFIFDVRPMVLDDLGLVPTLRRAARDRGRSAGVAISFDTLGPDQRLAPEAESAIFRMLDEAIAAFLETHPERLFVRLDWGDSLDARVGAVRPATGGGDGTASDLPPALAALIEERRAGEAAQQAGAHRFPEPILSEIRNLAATIGADAELLDDGLVVRLVVPLRDGA